MLVPSIQVRGSYARGFQAAVAPSTSWSCNTGLEHSSVGFAGGIVAADGGSQEGFAGGVEAAAGGSQRK